MLANGINVEIPTSAETQICSWISDGTRQVVGFFVSAPFGGQVRFYAGASELYRVDIPYSGENPFATLIDKPALHSPGTELSLKFYHENISPKNVSGAILG